MGVTRHRPRRPKRNSNRAKHIGGTVDSTRHEWARVRARILTRDDHTCQAKDDGCTGVAIEVDHVVPQHLGGTDDDENLISLCPECHARRTSRQAHERAVAREADKKERARRNHPGRKDRHDPA
ncbi:HNH endonuclease [Mycobacterium avium]|uniref:HNH endonuclease n=1 Tax=Mycobacterium avium TaxID=1764 RepID=UPI0009FB9B14